MRNCAVRVSRVIRSTFDGSGRYYSTLVRLDSRNMGMIEEDNGTRREADHASHFRPREGRRLVSAEKRAESTTNDAFRTSSLSVSKIWQTFRFSDRYQSLRHVLGGLWPAEPSGDMVESLLMAVPKRKVTPHRKGNRSATKFIRFIPIVSQCSKCQKVFPQHAMPSKCDDEECPAFNVRRNPQN